MAVVVGHLDPSEVPQAASLAVPPTIPSVSQAQVRGGRGGGLTQCGGEVWEVCGVVR